MWEDCGEQKGSNKCVPAPCSSHLCDIFQKLDTSHSSVYAYKMVCMMIPKLLLKGQFTTLYV